MKISRLAVAAAMSAAMCLLGATAALAKMQSGRARTLPLVVRFVPPSTCEISVADQLFSLPNDEDRMVAAMRQLRRAWKSAHIVGGMEIPYHCVGHAIFIAQQGGFKKVGFVAAPPK